MTFYPGILNSDLALLERQVLYSFLFSLTLSRFVNCSFSYVHFSLNFNVIVDMQENQ